MNVDAKRFQFKAGGGETGIGKRLQGVETWDPYKAGVIMVWEDRQGRFWVADGHQRVALARRLKAKGQAPKIVGVVMREVDGVTAEDARAYAASKNIAEGTGSSLDAAKALRARPDMAFNLPPTSSLVRDALGLQDPGARRGAIDRRRQRAGDRGQCRKADR